MFLLDRFINHIENFLGDENELPIENIAISMYHPKI